MRIKNVRRHQYVLQFIWTGLGSPVRRWQTGRSDSWVTQEASVENKEEEAKEEEKEVDGEKPLGPRLNLYD